jgi:hypothetical protein
MENVRILSESAARASRSIQRNSVCNAPGIARIREEIHEERDAPARLLHVPVHHVAGDFRIALEYADQIADVRRVNIFPV